MLIIPTQPAPSQLFTVQLNGQTCQINIDQKFYGLFLDLYVNNTLIIGGVICQNVNRIVRSVYLGFDGDVFFLDQQGNTDPVYTGLGTRYVLCYMTAAELAEIGIVG